MPIISNNDRRAAEQRARDLAQAERRPGETVAQTIHRLEEERRQMYAAGLRSEADRDRLARINAACAGLWALRREQRACAPLQD
jgi:tRNA(Ile2) C34 agmatinyltransferase TiaS